MNSLAQSLSANQSIPNTLSHLDLSGNVLRGDDLTVSFLFTSLNTIYIPLQTHLSLRPEKVTLDLTTEWTALCNHLGNLLNSDVSFLHTLR